MICPKCGSTAYKTIGLSKINRKTHERTLVGKCKECHKTYEFAEKDQIEEKRKIAEEKEKQRKEREKRALEIFERVKNGEQMKKIAKEFSVSPSLVGHIKNGRTWGRLTGLNKEEIKAEKEKRILEIFQARKEGKKEIDVAIKFGVSTEVVSAIKTGKHYAKITGAKKEERA